MRCDSCILVLLLTYLAEGDFFTPVSGTVPANIADKQKYSVSIITDPRNQKLFNVTQTATFLCVVNPQADSVTYKWFSIQAGSNWSPTTYLIQNISVTFKPTDLHYCSYFCEASLNGTVIGSARKLVEVQGCLRAAGPRERVKSFRHGGSLQLNIDLYDLIVTKVTSLAWYHNGTRIVPKRNNNYVLAKNDTSLTIKKMKSSDAGVYEVRINSTDAGQYRNLTNSPECDSLILPLLESVSYHAPVTFTVQEYIRPKFNPLSVVSAYYLKKGHHTLTLRSNNDHGTLGDEWFLV